MKKIIATILFTVFITVVSVSAQTDYCFKNDGLKKTTTISFTVKGGKIVDGEFDTGSDGTTSSEVYAFTGTKIGNVLTVKFARTVPEEFKKVKKLVWTLGETLKVQMYGKNYTTNKWGVYAATYEKCKEN